MSKTEKGGKRPGYEYWSRRPFAGWAPGSKTKRLTHKAERAEAKEVIKEQLADCEPDHREWEYQEIDEAWYCYHYGPCKTCQSRQESDANED